MKKGLIVPARIHIDRPRSITLEPGLDRRDLRRILLYWDQIVTVVANGVGSAIVDPEEGRFLRDEGILVDYLFCISEEDLSRDRVPTAIEIAETHLDTLRIDSALITARMGVPEMDEILASQQARSVAPGRVASVAFAGFAPEQIAAAHAIAKCAAFDELNRRTAGNVDWSIVHDFDLGNLQASRRVVQQVVELELLNALPVPSAATRLSRLLDFKRRHLPELLRFRAALSGFAARIAASDEPSEECVRVRNEIDVALAEIARCLERSGIERAFATIRSFVKLDPGQVLPAVLAAEALHLGQPLAAVAAVGVAALLKLTCRSVELPPTIAEHHADFAYVYESQRRLT